MASQPPQELPVDLPELDVPAGYFSIIPSLSVYTPVNTFRFHVLQEQQSTLVFPKASSSFSHSPPSPTYDPSMLARDPIPPSKYLRLLKKHLAGLPDSAQLSLHSIRNPVRNEELMPLWVITVWDEVSALRDSRDMWNDAYSWVKSLQVTQQHGDHTHVTFVHFATLGWNAPLSHYGLRGVTTLALPQFLSNNRINDEAVDLMAHFLSSKNALPSGVLVAQLSLSNFISSIRADDISLLPSPSHIQQIEQRLSQISELYFPSFYCEYQHWIAFKVNITRKEVTYSRFHSCSVLLVRLNALAGDSMGNSLPKPDMFIKNLLLWLNTCCDPGFKFSGRKLATGSQRDSSSCGFFAMNAISHAVFDTELLEHEGIHSHRLEWFNNLCAAIDDQVG